MILAVLQARMSSTRLPGKVLAPLAGAPMVLRQIERVVRARRIDRLVVATSVEPSDDVLAEVIGREGIGLHRGPLHDVLARFIGALDAFPAEHVVRLTADCPLADPMLIDAVIDHHLAMDADYSFNTPPGASVPKGQDAEVIAAEALRRAARAPSPEGREHVTWDIRHTPSQYRIAPLRAAEDQGAVRWTVDRPDDYAFVAEVYDTLYPADPTFTSDAVRRFVQSRPDLAVLGGDRRA